MAVLIEAYQHVLTVTGTPADCTQSLIAAFQKVDEKLRKYVLGSAVKEVDDFCRAELQSELDNIEKFVSIMTPVQ